MGNGNQEIHTWPPEIVEMSHKQVHIGTKIETQKAVTYAQPSIHTFLTIRDPLI